MGYSTLKKKLQQMEKGTIVKIGAKNGSNFVYVGEAHNYDEINNLFEKAFENKKKQLPTLWNVLKRKTASSPDTDDDSIIEYSEDIVNSYAAWKRCKEGIDNYKNVFKRSALEVFESGLPEEKGVMVVMVTGNEQGKYWTVSEKGL